MSLMPPPVTVSAIPVTINLVLYQGDDFYMDLTVKNSDGSNADLTGQTAQAQIRSSPGATDITATFIATISSNIVHLHLAHAEAAKVVGQGAWDCQLVGVNTTTIAAGWVQGSAEVTTS